MVIVNISKTHSTALIQAHVEYYDVPEDFKSRINTSRLLKPISQTNPNALPVSTIAVQMINGKFYSDCTPVGMDDGQFILIENFIYPI
ncbi:MAG: hypothetical protein ACRDDK_09205 [Cetobacterium sp.]